LGYKPNLAFGGAMAAKHRYKVGDRVQLVSGGPTMTIASEPTPYRKTYGCLWFPDNKVQHGDFPEEALKPAVIEGEHGRTQNHINDEAAQ
jgi:uncharacterized protein YodC (DUF2158 family)